MLILELLRDFRDEVTGDFVAAIAAEQFAERMKSEHSRDWKEWCESVALQHLTIELVRYERNSTHHGTGIQYEHYLDDVRFDFTVKTDQNMSEEEWAMLWTTSQEQGVGAARSQGNGRFVLTRWEQLDR